MTEITVFDANGNSINTLVQWDKGIDIYIRNEEIDKAYDVHFFNKNSENALVVKSSYTNKTLSAKIPNVLLTEPYPIIGYVYFQNGSEEKSIYFFRIVVRKKPKPSDYVNSNDADYIDAKYILSDFVRRSEEYYELVNDLASKVSNDVDSAKAYKEESELSADQASKSAFNALESAKSAKESEDVSYQNAQIAIQYSGKPPIPQGGVWMVWNAEAQEYRSTGEKSVLKPDVSYSSVDEMYADKDNQPVNTVAIISSNAEEEDNAKLFIRSDEADNGWRYLADLSGYRGVGLLNWEKTDGDGLPGTDDVYTVTWTNGQKFTYTVHNGDVGPVGPQGKNFTVIDHYDSLYELQSSIKSPNVGDAYSVGDKEPYDIYLFGEKSGWVNNGAIQGPKGEKGDQGDPGLQGIQGDRGPQGEQGVGISRIEFTSGDHSPGTIDEYTIVLDNNNTYKFQVYNGKQGPQGPAGESVAPSYTLPNAPGTNASIGYENTYARGDHRHPYPDRLSNSRTFIVDLESEYSDYFNGSSDAEPGVTGVLPISHGGTGAASEADARSALGITPSNIGAALENHSHSMSEFTGSLPMANGGTGVQNLGTQAKDNAIIYKTSTSSLGNYLWYISSGNGALYATTANGLPQFGTLPIAQGGTGATSAINARNALGAAAASHSHTASEIGAFESSNIETGLATVSCTANSVSSSTVKFKKSFSGIPRVAAQVYGAASTTVQIGIGITNLTTTGFTLNVLYSGSGSVQIYWLAARAE